MLWEFVLCWDKICWTKNTTDKFWTSDFLFVGQKTQTSAPTKFVGQKTQKATKNLLDNSDICWTKTQNLLDKKHKVQIQPKTGLRTFSLEDLCASARWLSRAVTRRTARSVLVRDGFATAVLHYSHSVPTTEGTVIGKGMVSEKSSKTLGKPTKSYFSGNGMLRPSLPMES